MEALGISLGYLITFTLSFGILFVVLRAWVFVPLLNHLEKRRLAIARGLEDARIAAEARANAEKEANRIITEAQSKAAAIIHEATVRAEKVEQEIRVQAENELVKSREAAMAELESERNRMLNELRGQIISLAISAAQKLLVVNLDEQRQRTLVNEFFSGIRGGTVTMLETSSFNGTETAEVTSALPLTEFEQDRICEQLFHQLGRMVSINFRVDPAILGGLVVRMGDRVIDGSISGQLTELRQSLR